MREQGLSALGPILILAGAIVSIFLNPFLFNWVMRMQQRLSDGEALVALLNAWRPTNEAERLIANKGQRVKTAP